MLKKMNRLALYIAVSAPLLILPQAYAEQPTTLTDMSINPIATATTAFDLSHSSIARDSLLIPVNINTASESELITLPGIGEGKARRIIAWRERNGDFKTTAALTNVNGIGQATVSKLSASITVIK